jgi:nucleoid DNA-binding protein
MYCKTLENFVNTIPSSVDEIASKHNWVELIGIRPFEIKEKTDDETHDI